MSHLHRTFTRVAFRAANRHMVTAAAIAVLALGLSSAGRAADTPTSLSTVGVDTSPGKKIYDENCAPCHSGGNLKAPRPEIFKFMAPPSVMDTLTNGVMKQQASTLSDEQRKQVTEYLTKKSLDSFKPPAPPKMCEGKAKDFDLSKPPIFAGWGYDTKRFVAAADAGLTAKDVPRLKLKWALAFPLALRARSQPVVAMNTIFVGSQDGTIFALDLDSGCARWTSNVGAEVRTAVVVEPWKKGSKLDHHPRLFFGDILGHVYAMDALDGKVLWRVRPEDHPNATITSAPVFHEGIVYVPISSFETMSTNDPNYACCTFRGSLVALDAANGVTKWQHYTVEQKPTEVGKTKIGVLSYAPSGAPVWTSPALDLKRGVVYHGSGENYSSPADGNSDALFAVDMKTGKRKWRQQMLSGDAWNNSCFVPNHPNCPSEKGPDFDLAASPMLVTLKNGKQIVIIGHKKGAVWGVDPDHEGAPLWKIQIGRSSNQGGVHFGMAAEGSRIYVPIYDSKYKSYGGFYSDVGAPGVHAVDAATGKVLWDGPIEDRCKGRDYCEPGVSAAITAMPGVVFAGHVDGWFRAYDGETGKIIWETDTTQPVTTVNGEEAHGGSMSGPGAAIADGHVITDSGYDFALKMPGNVLLVYTVDGK